MNRSEILERYNVSANGRITSPGKFEGEMLYVPYFWEFSLDGGSDFESDSASGTIVTPEDRLEFPEIGDIFGIMLEESDQGFIYTDEFKTEFEWNKACEAIESDPENGHVD